MIINKIINNDNNNNYKYDQYVAVVPKANELTKERLQRIVVVVLHDATRYMVYF